MSLFGDESIKAAARIVHEIHCDDCSRCDGPTKDDRVQAIPALDAALAALDRDELIEKAARAIAWADTPDPLCPGDPNVYVALARAALHAIGLLPGDTASADQREGKR